MLRRRPISSEGGPVETVARRRRRTLVLAVAGALVVLLLGTMLFLMAWLRESPSIDPRWARVSDAVALVRVRWQGADESLMRAPIESLLGPRLSGSMDFNTFWASVKFVIHSDLTVWFVPEESGAGSASGAGGSETAVSWIGALSLRRRPSFIEERLRKLLTQAGVRLPLGNEPEGEATQSGRRRELAGGVREGAVVVTSRADLLEEVLGALALASRAEPGGKPSPESVDDVWLRMPEDAAMGFVVRDPGTWGPRVLARVFGRSESPVLQTISSALPDVFQGTPWVIGDGRIVGTDTVELTARWSWSSRGESLEDQQRAVRVLIQNLNGVFSEMRGVNAEALPLEDASTGRIGMRIRIDGWSRAFPARQKRD